MNDNNLITQLQNKIKEHKESLSKLEDLKMIPNVQEKYEKIEEELQKDIQTLNNLLKEENKDTKTSNVLSLNDLLEELDKELKFNGKYLFMDNELGKYVKIDLQHKRVVKDEHGNTKVYYEKLVDYIDKGAISGTIKNTIKNLQSQGILDSSLDRHDSKVIKTIISRVETISQKFDRHEEQVYIANDMTVLNGFVKTPLIEYIPTNSLSYKELREILSTKFPRTEILLKNNVLDNEEHLKYILNWISAEMNVPQKVKTSIVLIGEQGSGKSVLTETVFRENIYDKTNVSIMSNSVWTDRFNSVFDGKTFLINNEISLSDRKETNDISELIKRLITDDTVFIRGMRKENVEKEVTFSQWFLSNKNEPVKIEFGDRRFSVFGRAKPLKNNKDLIEFLSNNNEDMDSFISQTKKEIREFLYLVKSLEFDSSVCKTPIENELKDKIIAKTNTKADLLKSAFNTKNWELFKNLLENFEMEKDFINKVEKMFEVGIFTNNALYEIYTTFFHSGSNEISNIDSGKWWNDILISVNKSISINNHDYRVKVFDDIFVNEKIEILKLILKHQEYTPLLKELQSLELKGYIDRKEVEVVYETIETDKEEEYPF